MRVGVAYVDVRVNMAEYKRDLSRLENKAKASVDRINATLGKVRAGFTTAAGAADNAAKAGNRVAASFDRQRRSAFSLLPHVAQVTVAYMAARAAWRSFASGVVAGAEFEHRMAYVKAISSDLAYGFKDMDEQFAALTAAAEKAGETTAWTAGQAAEALKYLAMAGFDARQSIEALPGVLQLALIGELDLGRATDIVTDSLNAMRLGISQLGRVNDVFVATITRTNTNIEMMGQAMKFAAPVAGVLGYEIEQVAAMIGILAQSGVKAGIAGRNIQQALVRTTKAAKAFNAGPGSDLIGILKKMNERQLEYEKTLGKVAARERIVEEARKQFGLIALKSILILKENVDAYDDLLEKLEDSQGEMKKASEIIENSTINVFKKLVSAITSISISIWRKYEDSVKEAIRSATEFVLDHKDIIMDYFDKAIDALKKYGPLLLKALKIWLEYKAVALILKEVAYTGAKVVSTIAAITAAVKIATTVGGLFVGVLAAMGGWLTILPALAAGVIVALYEMNKAFKEYDHTADNAKYKPEEYFGMGDPNYSPIKEMTKQIKEQKKAVDDIADSYGQVTIKLKEMIKEELEWQKTKYGQKWVKKEAGKLDLVLGREPGSVGVRSQIQIDEMRAQELQERAQKYPEVLRAMEEVREKLKAEAEFAFLKPYLGSDAAFEAAVNARIKALRAGYTKIENALKKFNAKMEEYAADFADIETKKYGDALNEIDRYERRTKAWIKENIKDEKERYNLLQRLAEGSRQERGAAAQDEADRVLKETDSFYSKYRTKVASYESELEQLEGDKFDTKIAKVQNWAKEKLYALSEVQASESERAKTIAEINDLLVRMTELYKKQGDEADKKEAARIASKKATAYKDITGDLEAGQGADLYLKYQQKSLALRKQAYMDLLVDEENMTEESAKSKILIEAWYTKEYERLLDEQRIATGDMLDGVIATYNKMKDEAKSWAAYTQDTILEFSDTLQSTMSDVLFDTMTGQLKSFADYWNAIWNTMLRQAINVLTEIAIRGSIIRGLEFISGASSSSAGSKAPIYLGSAEVAAAHGAAFDNGNIMAFASGGIVASPTLFGTSSGLGIAGEAGPEAVLPLKRSPTGDLGVVASGNDVYVEIYNSSGEEATVQKERKPNGDWLTKVFIGTIADDIVKGGKIDKALTTTGRKRKTGSFR